jgi:hypothetical protein
VAQGVGPEFNPSTAKEKKKVKSKKSKAFLLLAE